MINQRDLRAFTKQILNDDDDDDINDYDVNHLDYQYIEKCSDIKELKKLLKVLKSGKEGFFLHMEDEIQKRLEFLDPSLKKEPLPKKEDIANELNDWVNMLKKKDQSLKNKEVKTIFNKKDNNNVLTNELTFNTEEPSEKNNVNKLKTDNKDNQTEERIKSTDYRKWDLYNVDEVIKNIDEEDKKDNTYKNINNEYEIERKKKIEDYSRRLNKEKHIPAVSDDIKQKSYEELKVLAEIEKNKGNDCYKSKDYEEALIYYTRSLDLLEMPNVYTNRALINLKLSRFSEAEHDASEALRMNDPKFNFKAYLRRGESFSRRARYREAINDYSEALKLDPNNKEAENLLIKAQQKYLEVEGELAEKIDMKINESKKTTKPKKKMLIKEVDEIKEDVIIINTEKSKNNEQLTVVENSNTLNNNDKISKNNTILIKEANMESFKDIDNNENKTKTENNIDNNYTINDKKLNISEIEKSINNNKNINNDGYEKSLNENESNNEDKKSINNNISNNEDKKSINENISNNEDKKSINENIRNNEDKKSINENIRNNEDKKSINENMSNNEDENYEKNKLNVNKSVNLMNNNDNIKDFNKSNTEILSSVNMNEISILSEEEEEESNIEEDINIETTDILDRKVEELHTKDDINIETSNIIENMNEISILSEEEEEENTEYNDFSDTNNENKSNMSKHKRKFIDENEKKNLMKSYIDSLKFYNDFEEDDDNMNSISEEEIREKLERLNELKKYMQSKYELGIENEDEDEDEDEEVIIEEVGNYEEDENKNDNENNVNDVDNEYNDDKSEELNYMEFLKEKEKERFELYKKTMNNYSDDLDDDLNDIYNSDDEEEILSIINNQLRQNTLNGDEKKYISQLLKNKRSQASLGSDNSDFEDYEYESSNE